MSRDAIILAAGANTRLNGIVPAYMKPFLLVNGRPLILHALHHAVADWNVACVTTVVSPHNANYTIEVWPTLETKHHFVLQPSPLGVVDAICRALPLCQHEMVVILCADNTFSKMRHFNLENVSLIGTRRLSFDDARRFTRLVKRPTDGYEILEVDNPMDAHTVWVGPLVLPRVELEAHAHPSMTIVELIRACTDDGKNLFTIEMSCADFGIPEAL